MANSRTTEAVGLSTTAQSSTWRSAPPPTPPPTTTRPGRAHGGGDDDEGTPLGRIAVCEGALLGQAGTGAMVPRLRAIEEIALGAAGAGALPDRIAAVEAAIGLARAAPLIASDPTPALAPSNVAPADGAGDDDDAAVTLTVENDT